MPKVIYCETSTLQIPSSSNTQSRYLLETNGKQISTLSTGGKGYIAQINRSYDARVLRQRDTCIYASYILLSNSTTNTATYRRYQLSNLTNDGVTSMIVKIGQDKKGL